MKVCKENGAPGCRQSKSITEQSGKIKGFDMKIIAHFLALLLSLSILSGCGTTAKNADDEFVSPNPDGAPVASVEPDSARQTSDVAETAATESAAENRDAVRVSYLGPEGTYTEEAARSWFRNGEAFLPKDTVNDAIADVLAGNADFAVIPQENTLGGAVTGYVDALIAAENAFVVGEIVLPINQTLMGVPGATLADIRTVCSHAQGLTQSARWRAEYLPDAAAEEMASTAAAASFVADQQDKSLAAAPKEIRNRIRADILKNTLILQV